MVGKGTSKASTQVVLVMIYQDLFFIFKPNWQLRDLANNNPVY